MKIGILTFHWATNYGAILQAYALQTHLLKSGYNVEIVNYKPHQFDDSIWNFFRYRKFLNIKNYKNIRAKEYFLDLFRKKYLKLSPRYYHQAEIQKHISEYDILISGSDQVLNPSFLQYGEHGYSTAYFLGFEDHRIKKIGYAVSFGCNEYPPHLISNIKPLISDFDFISARESTGCDIIRKFDRMDVRLVPDPTLLLDSEDYINLISPSVNTDKIFLYVLHRRERFIYDKLVDSGLKLTESKSECLGEWLSNIYYSKAVITNSFHGTIFSILFHKPFVVILNHRTYSHMNDRFITLLTHLGLSDRILSEEEFDVVKLEKEIDWAIIDDKISKFRDIGIKFLEESIQY